MATLGSAFDSNQHDDMNNFDPIPAGEYIVKITNSDIVKTKDGAGKYISLEYTVIQGEFKGRKIWQNLNDEKPECQFLWSGVQKPSGIGFRSIGQCGGIFQCEKFCRGQ